MNRLRFDEARVLGQLVNTTDPWQIAGQVRIDFPRFVRTVGRLDRKGLIKTSRGRILLTPRGRGTARDLGFHPRQVVARRIEKARKAFVSIARQRPSSSSLYDQGYMDLDSVFRRVELITTLGDSDSKRVAILGDDDLMSIALCLSSRPENVTVLEIDERLADFIDKIAARRKLPIDIECVDLRVPLPRKLKGRFDTFVTDPSETFAGLRMFIGRGLRLLKAGEGRAGYFGLTTIEASYQKWARFQKWLLNGYALSLTHVLPRNAYYHNWQDLLTQTVCFSAECIRNTPEARWFNSSLVRLETLNGFRPKEIGKIRQSIFNDKEACGEIQ